MVDMKFRTEGKHAERVSYPAAWFLCCGQLTLPGPGGAVRDLGPPTPSSSAHGRWRRAVGHLLSP